MTTRPSEPKQFFWEHMINDMEIIKTLMNINLDDFLLFFHSMFILFNKSDDGSIFIIRNRYFIKKNYIHSDFIYSFSYGFHSHQKKVIFSMFKLSLWSFKIK